MVKLWRWALGLAILTRLLLLGSLIMNPLWYDENYTLVLLRLPWLNMIQATAGDVHPPLYYLVARLLTFGIDAPWLVRIPPLLFSIASLVVFWFFLRRYSQNATSGLAVFVIYAILPTSLFYAWEGRMYTWMTLITLLAFWSLYTRRTIWLGLLAAALLWTHNYGIFYVAALGLAVLVHRLPGWRRQLLALALAGLSFVPWIFVILRQMATIADTYWIIQLTAPSALFEYYKAWFVDSGLRANVPALVIFWGAIFYAVPLIRWSPMKWQYLVMAVGPFLMAVLASLVWQPLLLYRALIPSVPFGLLLLARPLFGRGPRPALLALAAFVPIALAISVRYYYIGTGIRGINDIRVIQSVTYADNHWKDGDLVLHMGAGSWVDSISYTTHPDAQRMVLPCAPVRGSLSAATIDAMNVQTVETVPAGRYWLFTEGSPMTPLCMEEQEAAYVQGADPVWCTVTSELQHSCLYLVTP